MQQNKIIILTWQDKDRADEALKKVKAWQKDKLLNIADAVVIVKDEEGRVKVRETEQLTTKKGIAWGGVAGLIVGTLVGGPVGGAILGGALGAGAAQLDLGIPEDKIKEVSDSLHGASSAIIAEVEGGNEEFLAAAIRQSDGQLYDISLTEEMKVDSEQLLTGATGSHQ